MADQQSAQAEIQSFIRNSVQNKFKQYFGANDISEVNVPDSDDILFGNWMGLIMVAGGALRITFKLQYNSKSVLNLAVTPIPYYDTRGVVAINDFVKEFCNMVAGHIKSRVEELGLSIGISLPLITKGFDDIFSPPINGNLILSDVWKIGNETSAVTCLCNIELFDLTILDKLKTLPKDGGAQGNEGEIEFL